MFEVLNKTIHKPDKPLVCSRWRQCNSHFEADRCWCISCRQESRYAVNDYCRLHMLNSKKGKSEQDLPPNWRAKEDCNLCLIAVYTWKMLETYRNTRYTYDTSNTENWNKTGTRFSSNFAGSSKENEKVFLKILYGINVKCKVEEYFEPDHFPDLSTYTAMRGNWLRILRIDHLKNFLAKMS